MENSNDYFINPDTMALIPLYDEYGNLYTLVVEQYQIFTVDEKPKKVVEDSGHYYGSDIYGLMKGTKKVTNYHHKVPILLCGSLGLFLFPSHSPNHPECIWFHHKHVNSVKCIGSRKAEIIMMNGYKIPVKTSRAILETQINRTAQYKHLLHERMNEETAVKMAVKNLMNKIKLPEIVLDERNTYRLNNHSETNL